MRQLHPLPKATVFEQVVQRLRSIIESGQIAPGERLPSEREFAESLGVNRSSVREALRVLEAAGLVDIQHGRGVFVRDSDDGLDILLLPLAGGEVPAELLPDLFEARSILESTLARLAAERGASDVTGLEAALTELEEAISHGEAPIGVDRAFHLEIARLARNRVLQALVKTTYALTEKRFDDFFAAGDRARRSLVQHRQIVEHIRAGDAVGAEEAMAAHMQDTARAWLRYIKDQQ
ncbi:MAG: HTH-type transcriptional regulator LutR [Acidimicrobiales bacterium]|nr:HTH-type transcriptional regulator LutR [Acidimicrobiales bacterium]